MKRQFSRSSLFKIAVPIIAILIFSIATAASPDYRYPTKTSVTSSPNPSLVGEFVTVTATVTVYYRAVPDGEVVNFYSRRSWIGSGTTVNGQVSFPAYFDKKGFYAVKAKFSGDQEFRPSQGGIEQQVCLNENCE